MQLLSISSSLRNPEGIESLVLTYPSINSYIENWQQRELRIVESDCTRRNTANINQWCIVLAGVADFARPAEKLSLTQNIALTATGAIWTRWCLIIKPRNVLYVPPPLLQSPQVLPSPPISPIYSRSPNSITLTKSPLHFHLFFISDLSP